MTMAFSEDLDEGARMAVAAMIDAMHEYCGLTWNDAYRLCSLCGDVRVTQVVNKQKGVHFMLPLDILNQLPGRMPYVS